MIDSILILAAGRGERLGDLTKNKPKPLLEIEANGTTILDRIILQCQSEFPSIKVHVNISYLAEKFLEYYSSKPFYSSPIFLYERRALGPASSLVEFQKLGNKKTLVIHGDLVLSNIGFQELAKVIRDSDNQIVVSHKRPQRQARSKISVGEGRIVSIDEFGLKSEKSLSMDMVSVCSGIYTIFTSSLQEYSPKENESLAPSLLNHAVLNHETIEFEWKEWRYAVDSPGIYFEARSQVLGQA